VTVVIKFKWLWDLCAPNAPGTHFSRFGHRVTVSEKDFHAAQAERDAGAKEVVFEARRDDGHYVLQSLTAIK
jgi:hypothetical protein